ncbi:MAG: DEAD/DEAH box helicase family protein [Candidatus Hodarchaeales archaeon]|jgi:superfamily II DNA or RNA helicase/predicted house-cleaning noncanonical NTP pyrophosphatase (MazG superfamily)
MLDSDYPIIYNKLVRDIVPEIIRRKGKIPVTSVLNENDFEFFLKMKLLEECHELFSSTSHEEYIKELSDILEVLHCIAFSREIHWDDIKNQRVLRRNSRGGFNKRIFLHAVKKSQYETVNKEHKPIFPRFIDKGSELSLIDVIKHELQEAKEFYIASAFCTRSIINLLIEPLTLFSKHGKIKLLTSIMNNFNNPDDLLHLRDNLPNLELKIFYPENSNRTGFHSLNPPPFHLKCYLFNKPNEEKNSIIIGSSNFTESGLTKNYEWNYYTNSEINLDFSNSNPIFDQILDTYQDYWKNHSIPISQDFIDFYRPRWNLEREFEKKRLAAFQEKDKLMIKPRDVQLEALNRLKQKRGNNIGKTTIIAATGLGKTYLSAFDFEQSEMDNILFIAHRENILHKARKSFRRVLKNPDFGIILSGNTKEKDWRRVTNRSSSVFGMVQTLSRTERLDRFTPDFFDYIVIDEFHHGEAISYKKLIEYFKPKFLLGLTATPERMDGRDVLKHCDYDISYEIRIFEAIEKGWLVPFQYFAIYDATDYSKIRWTGWGYDEQELETILTKDTRAELVISNLEKFLPATGKIKALAFCSSKNHARFMNHKFNEHGLTSVCLLGENNIESRENAIERLEDEKDSLKVICSVDIFGEGVDIPSISHILFLRLTQSFTVFQQQLGRGLRLQPNKEFLVVLDFVGNYRQSFVAPLFLQGYYSVQEYIDTPIRERKRKPPSGCYVSSDLEVQRIWNEEIQQILKRVKRDYILESLYHELRENIGQSPNLIDFFANPEAHDPYVFVKRFGGWLQTKKHMDDLTEYEQSIIGTPGEYFLAHIEKDLHPVKSYKMVVLQWLIQTDPLTSDWFVLDISKGFKRYFLDNPEYLSDYQDMARSSKPEEFPIKSVSRKLREMPLNYLSNKENKFFIFDREKDRFRLKSEVESWWHQEEYRELIKDRIVFSLKRYFYRKYNLH